jgi:phosphatidylglycerol:prolipoprotein diacylglycerol transferase
MHPLFELGDELVPSYALFVVLGWLLGGAIFYRAARRDGMSAEQTLAVMAGCAIGAMAGASVMSVLFVPWSELPTRLAEGSAFLGRTVIGGIAGGIVGVELTKKVIGYTLSTGDAFAVAIPLGHALGRVGCLLHGCCFGTPSSLPWAMRYPEGSYVHALHAGRSWIEESAAESLPVHPTPLYELAFDLTLFVILLSVRSKLQVRGSLFRLYLVAYASFRFVAEFVRGDSAAPEGAALKPVQLVLMTAALVYAARLWRSERASLPQRAVRARG